MLSGEIALRNNHYYYYYHDCLLILLLLYIMLYIIVAYLKLFTALSNAVCLHDASLYFGC